MRTLPFYGALFLIAALLWPPASYAQETLATDDQAVISWIRKQAVPIRHFEAGNGFADLRPLKKILRDVRVVGLGEATHGTREFFQVKHRLLEFLVREMGFTVFTLESSYAACQAINDYVLYGRGDRAAALTGQGYSPWDTEEVAAMIEWMRAYNQQVPDNKKVRFYGIDLWKNDRGRAEVLAYLQQYDAAQVPAVAALFDTLAREETKWPLLLEEARLKPLLPQVQQLVAHLAANRDALIAASSAKAYKQVLMYTKVMEQWLLANVKGSVSPDFKITDRSWLMAQNLLYLMEEMPEARFMTWFHNSHISKGSFFVEEPNLGFALQEALGAGYYALGFQFHQGAYQVRSITPDKHFGEFLERTFPGADDQSLPGYLARADKGDFFLNLRAPARHPAVAQWLDEPQREYIAAWGGWADYIEVKGIRKFYDGLLFIKNTTRTRPTKNALALAARQEGF